MRRRDIGHPVPHSFTDSVLERAATRGDSDHLSAKQAHAEDVEALAAHVLFAHIDDAFEAEQRADRGRGYSVLSGAGLGDHAARFSGGRPGVLHGSYSYLLQDDDGQVALTHSISAGLDYASVGPEHALLREMGRAEYVSVGDKQALEAASRLSRAEGRIPALESAHAVAEAIRLAPSAKGEIFVVNLSGRGDKDIDIYREHFPELDA